MGPFRSWLTLNTDLQQAEKLTIPIVGRVVGDVRLFGAGWNAERGLLTLGTFPGSKGKSVTLKLATRGEKLRSAKWRVAEVDPPELQVTLGEPEVIGERMTHVPVQVEVPAGLPPNGAPGRAGQ